MNDLALQTEKETDDVVQRILGEWQWIDATPDPRKEQLRKQQTQLLTLRSEYTDKAEAETEELELAELREHMTVLEKKIKRGQRTILQELVKANT